MAAPSERAFVGCTRMLRTFALSGKRPAEKPLSRRVINPAGDIRASHLRPGLAEETKPSPGFNSEEQPFLETSWATYRSRDAIFRLSCSRARMVRLRYQSQQS